MLDELEQLLKEAHISVEQELEIEDSGWIKSTSSPEIITDAARIETVKQSRLYWAKDPLAKQAIRLWTDYTFGTGMAWQCDDEPARKTLDSYWGAKANQCILSAKGQRTNSDKLLIDGEIFFALFLGAEVKIRRIDPLEITEIITDPDDRENPRYYKREWIDTLNRIHTDYYCSHLNPDDDGCLDSFGNIIKATQNDVVVYHLTINTIGSRGMPLLMPALEWIKQYRRFLASRVAIMLALSRFAWKAKVQGGSASIAATKTVLNDVSVPAGSVSVENMGVDMQPIRTDSNASGAYQDGRMLKLQISAAVGIPEQYFGDISIGNLATAKTVELPMMKMFQSYQTLWNDNFKDVDEIVLEHMGIDPMTPIDRDFPAIAPEDATAAATALQQIIAAFPEFADSRDVQQVALLALGINNTADVLDELDKQADEKKDNNSANTEIQNQTGNTSVTTPVPEIKTFESNIKITNALKLLKEAIQQREKNGK